MEYFIYFVFTAILIMVVIWGFLSLKDFIEDLRH